MPRRLDEGENLHRYLEPKDRYRHIYFEAIELVTGEMERFDQPDLRIIKDLEILLLNAANGELHVGQGYLSEALSSYIEGDIDQACLKIQLLMIPDMIKTAFDGNIKKVTTLRTLTDAMNKSDIYEGMLSEVDKLLKVYFAFPVTSATAACSNGQGRGWVQVCYRPSGSTIMARRHANPHHNVAYTGICNRNQDEEKA